LSKKKKQFFFVFSFIKDSPWRFVFSFATGAAIVNVTLLLFYSIYRLAVLKQSPPSFHFKVMLLPGSVSGMLWSCGNYLSIYAVLFLGQAVG
jgi:hypothetical protein